MSVSKFVGLFLLVLFVWIGVTLWILPMLPGDENLGVKGDAFGAVNALFSGFALTGVVIAILLQSEELKLQREELKDTRDELRGQKEQLAAQVESFSQSQFDQRFFETIRLYRQCIDGTSLKPFGAEIIIHGNGALSYFSDSFKPEEFAARAFDENDREFGQQFRTIMQLLEHAVRMLFDVRASTFHGSLLKANCSPADRRSFLYYVLEEECRVSSLQAKLIELTFFEGVSPHREGFDFKKLWPSAFGEQ